MTSNVTTTHDKLRLEAAKLFSRRGYGSTSMADIAARVGIRKASLYNYYASKADLLLELLDQSLNAWEQACTGALEREGPAEDRLAAYLTSVLRFSRTQSQAMGIIRLAAGQIPGDLRRRVRGVIARHERDWRRRLESLFAEAMEQGEIPPADPAAVALFWGVFVDGILINQVFVTDKAEPIVRTLQSLWACFWRGVSGRLPSAEVVP